MMTTFFNDLYQVFFCGETLHNDIKRSNAMMMVMMMIEDHCDDDGGDDDD